MLNKQDLQILRAKAHKLKPVILMGQKGLHDALYEEIKLALTTHELIKIKLSGENREAIKKVLEEINQICDCETVHFIGNTASVYRHNTKAKVSVLVS